MSALGFSFKVKNIELFKRSVRLRLPFRFGVVTLTECPQAFVSVEIENVAGKTWWGQSAEMMAPKWFDKNLSLSNEDNFNQLTDVLKSARTFYLSDSSPTTAFGHFARHYQAHQIHSQMSGFNPLLAAYGPAQIDKAIADAVCRANGLSFYEAVNKNTLGIDLSSNTLAPDMVDFDWSTFLRTLCPASSVAVRHTIGMVDPIVQSDISDPINDGLPQSLDQVIQKYGVTHFKIKISGDTEHDRDRLRRIAKIILNQNGSCFVSLDGNEQFDDMAQFSQWLSMMRSDKELISLFRVIGFIEQPVRRDQALISSITEIPLDWPVIIDESDGELDSFIKAKALGYCGVSSKACKGLYKSIINKARCQLWNSSLSTNRFFMTGEDLTTQAGLGVQQDLALVSLLGISHVERNGHHYVNGMAAIPRDEQMRFLESHPDLYEDSHGAVRVSIRDGRLQLGSLTCSAFSTLCEPDFNSMMQIT